MSFIRMTALAATLASVALPVVADAETDAEYRNAVSTFITLQGFTCGSVLTVTQREEPNAFDVVCAAKPDGSGEKLTYFFQLAGGKAIVKLEDS